MRSQAGHRCMLMQMDQDIGGEAVQFLLALRIVVEKFTKTPIAEIGEQEQAPLHIPCEDLRRAEANGREPFGDINERTGVLVRRRCIHQDRALVAAHNPEIAAEGCVARKWQNVGSSPAGSCKKIRGMRRRSHWGGHRLSHDGGTSAVKILSPSCWNWSDNRSAPGQAPSPACSGHSTSRTASTAASKPSSSTSEGFSIRYRSTCHTGGSSAS